MKNTLSGNVHFEEKVSDTSQQTSSEKQSSQKMILNKQRIQEMHENVEKSIHLILETASKEEVSNLEKGEQIYQYLEAYKEKYKEIGQLSLEELEYIFELERVWVYEFFGWEGGARKFAELLNNNRENLEYYYKVARIRFYYRDYTEARDILVRGMEKCSSKDFVLKNACTILKDKAEEKMMDNSNINTARQ